jgi:hypothetical protein
VCENVDEQKSEKKEIKTNEVFTQTDEKKEETYKEIENDDRFTDCAQRIPSPCFPLGDTNEDIFSCESTSYDSDILTLSEAKKMILKKRSASTNCSKTNMIDYDDVHHARIMKRKENKKKRTACNLENCRHFFSTIKT